MRRVQHHSAVSSSTVIIPLHQHNQLRFRGNTSNRKTTYWQVSELERENSAQARLRDLSCSSVSPFTNPKNQSQLRITLQKAPSLSHLLESLDKEDDTGYSSVGFGQELDFIIHRNNNNNNNNGHHHHQNKNSSSLLPTSPIPIDTNRATDSELLNGPPSVESLLPWLEAPAASKSAASSSSSSLREKTYLAQAEVSTGRKELWAKTVSDPTRRRQLVDTLWTYICDAEDQTREVERDAYRTFIRSKENSDEFVHWIRKMVDDGEDAFWDWPDPDEVTSQEKRQMQLEALSGKNNSSLLLGGDSSDSSKLIEQQRIDAALLRKVERKNLGSSMVGGDISVDTPLAPYEDLPFLKMRMQENPDSLDPALKSYAFQNLEIVNDQYGNNNNNNSNKEKAENEVESGGDDIRASVGESNLHDNMVDSIENITGSNNSDILEESKDRNSTSFLKTVSTSPSSSSSATPKPVAKTPEEKSRLRLEKRMRRIEVGRRLHLPAKHRVKMRSATFDNEGVYFHVASKELAQQQTGGNKINKTSTASSSIDEILAADSHSVTKSFFKPKMVKATDDISKGVVKIDWPTVRAAFAGKRKTDYSREDQAAARERIIRLCRGEDPNTL